MIFFSGHPYIMGYVTASHNSYTSVLAIIGHGMDTKKPQVILHWAWPGDVCSLWLARKSFLMVDTVSMITATITLSMS